MTQNDLKWTKGSKYDLKPSKTAQNHLKQPKITNVKT